MGKYSPLKIFNYPEKVAALRAGIITPPIHVRIKPTNVCNHRCRYCAYRSPDLQLGETMNVRDFIPREKMAQIVDDLIEMKVKAVTFSGGGDPFCYPWLLETAAMLNLYGVKFAALTNGSRLTGEVAEFFAVHAAWVRVSIDGWNGMSYACYRGTDRDEFYKVLCNVAYFVQMGGKLGVVINVDATNAGHVFELINQLAHIGVTSVKVAPIVVSNDGVANAEYHRPLVETIRRQIADAASAYPSIEISNGYNADFTSYAKSYVWCPALQIRPVIAADCNVYSCQDKAYNPTGLLFSIKEQGFAAGWNAGREQFTRIDPSRDCAHHCAMHSINQALFDFWETEDVAFV